MLRRSTASANGTASPGRYTKRCVAISSRLRGSARNARGGLAARDHRAEAVEVREEGAPTFEDADVVEGGIPARVDVADERERALEVLERRPGVAVVGAEAREVDVAEVEHVVGLDVEA